jgi:hypothetical protein
VANRRTFLKTTGTLGGSLWLSSIAISALAPELTWALELKNLSSAHGASLLALTRHIYPHATLDDAVYAFVVKDLDAAAADDPALATLLSTGIETLNSAAGGAWRELDPAARLEIVESIATTPFFEKVRATAVVSLYNNELAFAHFGYEGSSFEHGGYLERGFNDLTWLPPPPASASPRAAE